MNNGKKKVGQIRAEIVVDLTREDVEDIIVGALEGGIGYWCCLDNRGDAFEYAPEDEPTAITAAKLVLDGPGILLIDEEEEKTYELSLERFLNGFRLWLENGGDTYGAVSKLGVDTYQIDADAADAIIQYALFGEVMYG